MTIEVLFTTDMKLQAMADKYYSGIKWEPKAGDYYTSSRADLELYKVVEVTETKVKTIYVNNPQNISEWDKEGFTSEGFGINRVHIPNNSTIGINNVLTHAKEYAKIICAKHPEQIGDTELIIQQLIIKAKTGLI